MSKLFITDNGRPLKDHNEEVTRWRHVKKVFKLPQAAANADADLWFMASPYADNKLPLRVRVNGKQAATIKPVDDRAAYRWHHVRLKANQLKTGANEVLFDCDTPAMNAWRLAIDNTADNGCSFVSDDGGATWRGDRMGLYNVLRGAYVARLRSLSEKLQDAKPQAAVYADASDARLKELKKMLPGSITSQRDAWKQVLALRTWVATRWSHDPFGPPYAPWDAATILDWAKHDRGHSGKGKVTMCVHFAVVFATFATALGHRSRCIALTNSIDGMTGHFVAEVFDEQRGAWVVHDANYDAHYEDGAPLSAVDISTRVAAGAAIRPMVRAGRGMPTKPARVLRGFRRHFATGASYRHVAVWRRMDFINDPALAAANHGSIAYCEPEWMWFVAPGVEADAELGMFPCRVEDSAWFK